MSITLSPRKVRLPRTLARVGLTLVLGAAIAGTQLAASPATWAASPAAIASESPAAILAASAHAIAGVSSLRVSGSAVENGAEITLDMAIAAGRGGQGYVAIDGSGCQIVVIGKAVYLKGSASFWRKAGGSGAGALLLGGRWIKGSTTGHLASLSMFTSVSKLFEKPLHPTGVLAKGPVTTVRGQQVVPISDRATGALVYVAATGAPYPVEIVNDTKRHSVVAVSGIDQPVVLVAPAGAIDITKLGG